MKKLLTCFLLGAFCIAACKKEKKDPATPTPSANPVANVTSNSNPALLPDFTHIPCSGFLSTHIDMRALQPPTFTVPECNASFHTVPAEFPGNDFLAVKEVRLNGDSLSLLYNTDDDSPMYYQADHFTDKLEQLWEVKGAGDIPSFSVSMAIPAPSADLSNIPDTIKMSSAVITINNVANATTASFSCWAYGQSGHYVPVGLGPGNNRIVITREDLQNLNMKNGLSVYVTLENAMFKTIEGKTFKFSKSFSYQKRIVVVR